MIRKKVLCSSLILFALLLSKLYSTPHNNASSGDKIVGPKLVVVPTHHGDDEEKKEKSNSFESYMNSLTFAEDSLPMDRPLVESKLRKFFSRFSFKKTGSYDMHKKAETYLPMIAKILKSHGIPEDFKYIPLVESGLSKAVVSSKGAGGYWQFMPATARLYGLKVNSTVDDRKDLVKSTHAAARYLKYLYGQFGNWTLVAAAYNVGDGSLRGSIRRQKKDDYFALKLNNETGSYVYKLVSMKEIIEHPQKHGYSRYANKESETLDKEPNML
ncbi:lytic transglycosylase domain-containing protein [Sphingobacterium sp. UBA5670]|uniref:lytic transglycosylase domain-containing protein n=1 Tax=Sphingobacterium sp. UBA5670 TaxID=1947502 RepID=UPI0025ED57AB|nr:lytic transglycosylase domain-containing protein [Sphingobacterium sp. UBA5670]